MTKLEINLLPRPIVLRRNRRLYVAGISRFLWRMSLTIGLVLLAEVGLLFAYQQIVRDVEDLVVDAEDKTFETQERVKQVNEVVDKIQRQRQRTVVWSGRIEDVLRNVPGDVRVISFSVEEEGVLELVGSSPARSQVLKLEENLRAIDWVATLDAPLQNFALDPGAEFTFTLYDENATTEE